MPFHSTAIFSLAHLFPLSLAHLPQEKHLWNSLSSITKALMTHTLASLWRKQSCYQYFVISLLYRCDGFVVVCSTVGCLCDNPRGAGGYEIVTMTTLRRNCCRFGKVFVAGCTGNCHAGNLHCGRSAEIASKWRFYLIFFFAFGNNLWAFWWVRILIL